MERTRVVVAGLMLVTACSASTNTVAGLSRPTAAPTVTPPPTATLSPSPTATPAPAVTPPPTPAPTPLPPTATAAPTATPTPIAPTATAAPTVTPTPIPPDQLVGGTSLAGRHGLTLQWISWEPDEWGSIRFEPLGNETYRLFGRQDGQDGDYVVVDGIATKISDVELRFRGTVEVQVSHTNGGEPCSRQGDVTFLSTVNRRFWRMQDLLNCDGIVTDYVDIYFG